MRCWDSERITGNDKGVNCSFSLFFVCNAFILCYFNSKRKGLELIDSYWFLFDMLMKWMLKNSECLCESLLVHTIFFYFSDWKTNGKIKNENRWELFCVYSFSARVFSLRYKTLIVLFKESSVCPYQAGVLLQRYLKSVKNRAFFIPVKCPQPAIVNDST